MSARQVPPPCICKLMPVGHKAVRTVKYIARTPHTDWMIHDLIPATFTKKKR